TSPSRGPCRRTGEPGEAPPLVPISFPRRAGQGAPTGSQTHDPEPTSGFSRLRERTSGEGVWTCGASARPTRVRCLSSRTGTVPVGTGFSGAFPGRFRIPYGRAYGAAKRCDRKAFADLRPSTVLVAAWVRISPPPLAESQPYDGRAKWSG